jgi:hypothetical protein
MSSVGGMGKMGGRVVKGKWAKTADCAHRSQLAKNSANSSISYAPFAKNRNVGDLTTAAKSQKSRFWRNNSPCLLRQGVAQQQMRGIAAARGKKVPSNE